MKNKTMQNFTWWFGVIFVGVILGVSLQFTRAWTNPPSSPPADNLGAPVNTSLNTQYKSGALGVGGVLRTYSNLYVDGLVGIGTTNPMEDMGKVQIYSPDHAAGVSIETPAGKWAGFVMADEINGYNDLVGWGVHKDSTGKFHIRSFNGAPNQGNHFSPMVIDTDGNVGIGTITPQAQLDVQGKIKMRSQTQASDSNDTVVTKGYLDSVVGGGGSVNCGVLCTAWVSGSPLAMAWTDWTPVVSSNKIVGLFCHDRVTFDEIRVENLRVNSNLTRARCNSFQQGRSTRACVRYCD